MTAVPTESEPPDSTDLTFDNRTGEDIVWGSGTYYGDASGGMYTSVPSLRRVGVGVGCVSELGTLRFGVNTRLPGPLQTVPRGELFAILTLANLAEPVSIIDFVTDQLNVCNAFNLGCSYCARTSNCDLFALLFK